MKKLLGYLAIVAAIAYAVSVFQRAQAINVGSCATSSSACYFYLLANSSYGSSVKSIQVANNTTSVAVDASAGTLYGIRAFNNSGTIAYGKLYNTAQGSVTCGSGTPVDRFMIPAGSSGAGFIWTSTVGVMYSTAITICVTTGFGDSDTTAPAASTYEVSFDYK